MKDIKKLNFLKERLKSEKVETILIFYKGRMISKMIGLEYSRTEKDAFFFKISNSKTNYVLSKEEIEDLLVIPFDSTIIILILNSDINIEIKFVKE